MQAKCFGDDKNISPLPGIETNLIMQPMAYLLHRILCPESYENEDLKYEVFRTPAEPKLLYSEAYNGVVL